MRTWLTLIVAVLMAGLARAADPAPIKLTQDEKKDEKKQPELVPAPKGEPLVPPYQTELGPLRPPAPPQPAGPAPAGFCSSPACAACGGGNGGCGSCGGGCHYDCNIRKWLCHRSVTGKCGSCCCGFRQPSIYDYFICYPCKECAKYEAAPCGPCSSCCGGWKPFWATGQRVLPLPTGHGVLNCN